MRKDEHTIALLEGFVMGNVDYNDLQAAVDASETYTNTEEALTLFNSSLQAIEFASLRKELKKIAEEES